MALLIPIFKEEWQQESVVTRKMLALVPEENFDWKPHPKSMSLKQLAGHVAELPSWASMAFHSDELNFATAPYVGPTINNTNDLLAVFERNLEGALKNLDQASEDVLDKQWLLKNGDTVLMNLTKGGLVRHALSQTIHHRAQLGVFLRLLDIPIPGTYGPSADDAGFKA